MKNKIKLFGLIALTVAVIFTMTACKDPGGDTGLNGTWIDSSGEMRFVMNKGNLTVGVKTNDKYDD